MIGLGKIILIIILKNIPFINQTSSNLSTSNFNSVSLNNYFDNNFPKEKEKNLNWMILLNK